MIQKLQPKHGIFLFYFFVIFYYIIGLNFNNNEEIPLKKFYKAYTNDKIISNAQKKIKFKI